MPLANVKTSFKGLKFICHLQFMIWFFVFWKSPTL